MHVFAAAAGLSVLFHAVPSLYMAVKLVGAALPDVAGRRDVSQTRDDDRLIARVEPKSARRAFFESVTVEVLDPKTAIFFLAFLPQFIDVSAEFPSGCNSSCSAPSSI